MKLIDWINELRYIVANYSTNRAVVNRQLLATAQQINAVERIMRERTEVSVDAPVYRGQPATVVMVGRYKGNDFVEIYQILPEDFSSLVDHLRHASKYAKVNRVDAPFQLREYIKKDLGL